MKMETKQALRRKAALLTGKGLIGFAKMLTGVRATWLAPPVADQTLYFANHNSHADFMLIWATLPPDLRIITRPVAGADYWLSSRLKRFIGRDVINALMIRRDGASPAGEGGSGSTPVEQMVAALQAGDSLIMFPEGTRNMGDDLLLPIKSGIYHTARGFPQVRLVPVWIENLKRVLPKGEIVPVPLACTVCYGKPIMIEADEDKNAFLARVRQALLDLRPAHERLHDVPAAASPERMPRVAAVEADFQPTHPSPDAAMQIDSRKHAGGVDE